MCVFTCIRCPVCEQFIEIVYFVQKKHCSMCHINLNLNIDFLLLNLETVPVYIFYTQTRFYIVKQKPVWLVIFNTRWRAQRCPWWKKFEKNVSLKHPPATHECPQKNSAHSVQFFCINYPNIVKHIVDDGKLEVLRPNLRKLSRCLKTGFYWVPALIFKN